MCCVPPTLVRDAPVASRAKPGVESANVTLLRGVNNLSRFQCVTHLQQASAFSAPPTYKHHRRACALVYNHECIGFMHYSTSRAHQHPPASLARSRGHGFFLNHEHAQPLRSGAGGTASARCLTPRMHQNSGLDSLLSRTRTRNATCRNMQYGTVPSSTVLSKNAIWH